jgi:hypothetical protein
MKCQLKISIFIVVPLDSIKYWFSFSWYWAFLYLTILYLCSFRGELLFQLHLYLVFLIVEETFKVIPGSPCREWVPFFVHHRVFCVIPLNLRLGVSAKYFMFGITWKNSLFPESYVIWIYFHQTRRLSLAAQLAGGRMRLEVIDLDFHPTSWMSHKAKQ